MQGTILIADDDPLMVAVVEHHLNAAGFSTHSVSSGADALDYICARRPSVAILDSMMPGMSGVEVLRRLQREGRSHQSKVIMLTALSEERHVVAAFKLGAADFIAKPFSPDELVARVSRLISAHVA
ncbi:MAG: hypothetical protein A4S17_11100 [Proteobacteria bacterium HN_bin10]|nr:MAG: hypothetical protein A4S17_11100 [Proteobacteria bacterium HN_bin10]